MTAQGPGGFTLVPTGVLRNPAVSPGARTLYAILLSYGHGPPSACAPTQDRLAADVGCSVRTVQRLLQELQTAGLVEVRQQGLSRPNAYEIRAAAREVGA